MPGLAINCGLLLTIDVREFLIVVALHFRLLLVQRSWARRIHGGCLNHDFVVGEFTIFLLVQVLWSSHLGRISCRNVLLCVADSLHASSLGLVFHGFVVLRLIAEALLLRAI